ncbi:MAG: acyltransferase family protein [Acidimicrobiia bacterium]
MTTLTTDHLDAAPAAAAPVGPRPGTGGGRTLRHLPGLDGLRAISVLAVLAYHLDLAGGRARGGYLGVEVFFVVSGYLITGLLLAERAATGHIDVAAFWRRRARRLLPAVVVVVVATCAYGAAFARPDLAAFRGDAVASLLYVQNWWAIVSDQSYFAVFGRPSPLRHLWSLAIEEQFYLLWPILFAVGVRLLGRRVTLGFTVAAALASVWWMAAHADVAALERAYYGADTRAFSLLVGAAMAFLWRPGRRFVDHRGRNRPRAIDLVALAGLVGLLWQFDHRSEYDPWTFPWGLLWIDALTVVLIVASATVGSRVGRFLGLRPLTAIGRRSYSLYLWHWPVFAFTRPGLDIPLTGFWADAARITGAIVLAEASYRLVEQPFRDGRAQARIRRTVERLQRTGRFELATAGVAVACGAWVLAILTATDTAIERSESALSAAVTTPVATPAGADRTPVDGATASGAATVGTALGAATGESGHPVAEALAAGATAGVPAPAPGPAGSSPGADGQPATGTGAPATDGGTAVVPPGTAPDPAATPPAPVAPPDLPVTVVGESVTLGAANALQQRFSVVGIDAEVGRQAHETVDRVVAMAQQGTLQPNVVVHVGNNGPVPEAELERLWAAVAPRRLVLVTVSVPRRWEDQVNGAVTSFAATHPGVAVVDWKAATAEVPDLLVSDGVHLSTAGIARYVELVAAVVTQP